MNVQWSFAVVLSCALAAPVAAQGPASWREAIEPVRIADQLYYVGSAGLGAFLLTSDEGHVLIDGPLEENVALVLDNVRALGFDPYDVRVLLATHAHADHVGGLAGLEEATGGRLLASEGDAPFLESGRNFAFDGATYPPVEVSGTLTHLEPVRVGPLELVPHVTPGHTPGCTSWSGRVTIEGEPHTFLILCSLSALSDYRLGGEDPTYRGQAQDFCQSVAHLRTLDPDIFLANHQEFFGLADKAEARRAGDVRAGAAVVFVEGEQGAAVFDREAQCAGPAEKAEFVQVAVVKDAIAVGAALGDDEADVFIITDGFGGQIGAVCGFRDVHVSAPVARFRRRALVTTATLDSAIAAAASIGDRRSPVAG